MKSIRIGCGSASWGDMLDPAQLPASMSMDDAVEALEGAFASAFIRATKPRG